MKLELNSIKKVILSLERAWFFLNRRLKSDVLEEEIEILRAAVK